MCSFGFFAANPYEQLILTLELFIISLFVTINNRGFQFLPARLLGETAHYSLLL